MIKKAQSMTEYAVLMALIVSAIVAMQVYVKRAVSGRFKSGADQIGEQFTTGQRHTIQEITQSARRDISGQGDTTNLSQGWSTSTILGNADLQDYAEGRPTFNAVHSGFGWKTDAYAGHEIRTTDYVDADAGSGALGDHSTFNYGEFVSVNPFTEHLGGGADGGDGN